MLKRTSEEFIELSRKIHGSRYDYTKVDYINSSTKVVIICKVHGEFKQTPNSHTSQKQGCSRCGGRCKKTVNEFIKDSKKVHGDKYDYTKVDYINSSTKVIIICEIHGEFEQTPNNHTSQKQGCLKCSGNGRKTSKEFIKDSKKVHGDKYDYTKVSYVNNKTKVSILCNLHNYRFDIRPDDFLRGKSGCPTCSSFRKASRLSKGTDYFIRKSKEMHGDKYDYSLSVYTTRRKSLKIICSKHGIFNQKPGEHYSSGCVMCNSSKGEISIVNYLDVNNIKYTAQKTFDGCLYKSKLKFDFYLPEYNICIEYDGKQHYEPIDFFGGKSAFESLQIRDGIKNNYCKDNNIQLIRIPYTKFDDIEEILSNQLNNSSIDSSLFS